MLSLGHQLELAHCPHCSVDRPLLLAQWQSHSTDYAHANPRYWRVYKCQRCGGMVMAAGLGFDFPVKEQYPASLQVASCIPDPARTLLQQAIASFHAPAGSVLLVESAVDAMLRERGYCEGSVYCRLGQASVEQVISAEMLTWARQIRLSPECAPPSHTPARLPTRDDARQAVELGLALAELLFVLPARALQGIRDTAPEE